LPYLFDTDAVSEVLRPKPLPTFVEWLHSVPREDQFISAVTVGELYHGAYRSAARERHLANIEQRVLPAVSILPYDAAVARIFGQLRADLERAGTRLDDADLQIASTALHHGLELVTGNVRHFGRVPDLRINTALLDGRS
jgi:predicted nucleic acid-binding protein